MSGGHPYRMAHRTVSSTLTHEEYRQLSEVAQRRQLLPSSFATLLIRAEIAKEKQEADAR